jgi:hypothetical protein
LLTSYALALDPDNIRHLFLFSHPARPQFRHLRFPIFYVCRFSSQILQTDKTKIPPRAGSQIAFADDVNLKAARLPMAFSTVHRANKPDMKQIAKCLCCTKTQNYKAGRAGVRLTPLSVLIAELAPHQYFHHGWAK